MDKVRGGAAWPALQPGHTTLTPSAASRAKVGCPPSFSPFPKYAGHWTACSLAYGLRGGCGGQTRLHSLTFSIPLKGRPWRIRGVRAEEVSFLLAVLDS